jgi:hypothetical protein
MKVLLITGLAIVLTGMTYWPHASLPAAAEPRSAAQAQPTDFQRPDVAPLPADGKFQVVSETPWQGDRVRVFFLGAQFCPFCAAERWALVGALERFGTLTGYAPETHTPGMAGFQLVPTYDLRKPSTPAST